MNRHATQRFLDRIVRGAIERVVASAGKTYVVDQGLSQGELLGEVMRRSVDLARGTARVRALVFLGSRVRLIGRRRLQLGRLAAVGAGSYIDARSKEGVRLGAGAKVGRNATITCTSHLSTLGRGFVLGASSGIGDYAHIGCSGGVFIGSDVIIGPFVSFHSQEHVFSDGTRPIRSQGTREASITIEDDVWVGARVTFLAGVTIGRGSVVAAGSVVRSSFPERSVIGGVPARLLRVRDDVVGTSGPDEAPD